MTDRAETGGATSAILLEERFRRCGEPRVSYVRVLTPDEAHRIFPMLFSEPPLVEQVYALFGVDGIPVYIGDTNCAMLRYAMKQRRIIRLRQ